MAGLRRALAVIGEVSAVMLAFFMAGAASAFMVFLGAGGVGRAMLAAFAAGLGGFFTIIRKITRVRVLCHVFYPLAVEVRSACAARPAGVWPTGKTHLVRKAGRCNRKNRRLPGFNLALGLGGEWLPK